MDPTQIISGVIAVLVVGGAVVLTALQVPVPEQIFTWGGVIVGFFFGSVTGRALARSK